MQTLKYLVFGIFFLLSASMQAQLISYTEIDYYTTEDMQVVLDDFGAPNGLFDLKYEVRAFKVFYEMYDERGDSMVVATGAFAMPVDHLCKAPMASYQHGTSASKTGVPSYGSAELNIGVIFASIGYYTQMPDYMGLGDSPGLHPYMHARSEALSVTEMLGACKEIVEAENGSINEQLFLFGYSQGGHATMAAHKLIQEEYADEFVVTASNPMSGPYDLSGVQSATIVQDIPYANPSYLPYVLLGYNEIYDVYDNPGDMFKAPYDVLLPDLFYAGTNGNGEIDSQMPSIPNQVLQDTLLENYLNDPTHFFHANLADNDNYNWIPTSPVRMVYCTGDEQVFYQNSLVAYDWMTDNGAENIEAMELGDGDHNECVPPALIGGYLFFTEMTDFFNGIEVEADVTDIPGEPGSTEDGGIDLNVSGGEGTLTFEWTFPNGSTASTEDIENIGDGIHTVVITDETGCSITESYEVIALVNTSDIEVNYLHMYPNPSQGDVIISLPEDGSSFYNLEIMDATGRLIYASYAITGSQYLLQQNTLSAGMYTVHLKGDKLYSNKLIIK